ncbi:MAG: HD domain-containing protein [Deltaproteobacteria bacterium]|jgi:PAS domain S-box-containing protein|nr:HD domain-containing protein [Deltaproteobacteria bacterium]
MMKATINGSPASYAGSGKVTKSELFKRIELLEQEKLQAELVSQESLLRCEAKYRATLDSIDAHITLVDRSLRILWANEKAKEIFGLDIEGKYCCEALYGGKELCLDGSSCMTRHALRNVNTVKCHSLKTISRGGADKYFECNARVVSWDNNGKPSVVAKIFKDITEQKQVENELRDSMKMLRRNLACTIQAISRTVETRDAYTAGHQRRTTEVARSIALAMGLSKEEIEGIRMAGVIHDLGKISVPAEILSKPGKLSEPEFSLIKQHPQTGYEILKGIDFNWPVDDIVLQHHERIDGSGYPYNLKKDEILLEARIIGVADVIEAMSSHRPYRPALGIDEALKEITINRGILYDPDVVDAAEDLFTKRKYQFN